MTRRGLRTLLLPKTKGLALEEVFQGDWKDKVSANRDPDYDSGVLGG